MSKNILKTIGILLIAIAMTAALSFYRAFAVMFIYNSLVPGITGWAQITYWQSFGISLLFGVVTSGMAAAFGDINGKLNEGQGPGVHYDFGSGIVEAILISLILVIFLMFRGLM